MYTLDVVDRHAVVYEPKSAMDENWHEAKVKNAIRANASKSAHVVVLNDQGGNQISVENDVLSPTLRAQSHQHEPVVVYEAERDCNREQSIASKVYGIDCRNGVLNKEICATLQAKANGGQSLNCTHPILYSTEGANEDL